MIAEYKKILDQIKDLTSQKNKLRDQILLEPEAPEEDGIIAQVSTRLRVTYDLEQLEFELAHQGFSPDEYADFKVCLKKVESLVSSGKLDPSLFDKCATVNEIKTLTVKENK
jgi:hypothetical protein